MTGRLVLVADDAGNQLATGPAYTQAPLERLRHEIDDCGWTATATVPHYSRGDFTCARGCGGGLIKEAAQ